MDRLSARVVRLCALSGLGAVCSGCPGTAKDAPPPPEHFEIASAAPHALGALAGGTEAAPHAVTAAGPLPRLAPGESDPDEDEDDGGAALPDAGLAPEDIPL